MLPGSTTTSPLRSNQSFVDIVLIAARSATYFQANQSVRMEATAVLDERATLWGAHTFNEVFTYETSFC